MMSSIVINLLFMRLFIVGILAFSFFSSPLAVSAQTLEQLQAQLSGLLQQLQTVESGGASIPSGYGAV